MNTKINPNIPDISYTEAGKFEETRFEKIHNVIFDSSNEASIIVAQEIASLIWDKTNRNESCVLGLATGSSPIKVYEELVRMHKEDGLSFVNVITFNLDEYYPMDKNNIQSYHYFMNEHLFKHIDILPENINIPHGKISPEELYQYCIDYETKIKKAGGIDFQLLGIGRTGHIGFNEPGSHFNSGTRNITLDYITRTDAASSFLGIDNVPRKAITMGIGSVRSAKRIVLLAWGISKAEILMKTIEGEMSSQLPATYLQDHNNTTFVLDKGASVSLTRVKTPWLVMSCFWTESLKLKAVVWLSGLTHKPILKLTDKDYNNNGMSGLLTLEGTAYDLNIKMFNKMQHTITGWPAGKPNADDENRPERAAIPKKRIIIFSPHPDDDVISMGGTFARLIEQNHEVHVAYQTSGNIAVSNDEVKKYIEVSESFITDKETLEELSSLKNNLSKLTSKRLKKASLDIKSAIRKSECLAAGRFLELPENHLHFMNSPFYETGEIVKNEPSEVDIKNTINIIKEIKPHQIFAAGDLADPHGTHRICLDIIFDSLKVIKDESFMKDCWLWLYRGAWQEWNIEDIEMAVPLSPGQYYKKEMQFFFINLKKIK